MIQKQANNNSFYFGNARKTIQEIQANLDISSLIILDQVHGNEGRVIAKENSHMPFKSAQGDFLITNEKNIGLGILTADCLPIIFIDAEHNAVGIAHAGWRGSVQNIAVITMQHMQQQYGTNVQNVSIFFGPCAKVCCYRVQKDFVTHVGLLALVQRGDNLFFDLPAFNKHQLLSFGLPQTAFNDQYNCCTICNEDYFSYRRQGAAADRQVSVVVIK